MKSWPRSRIRELAIEWDKRHREWILQRLAEMYRPREITTMAMVEYAIDWGLGERTGPEAQERFDSIRAFVYAKVKHYAYNKRSGPIQAKIQEYRDKFKKQLAENYRDANKFARVRDLAIIKEMAMKDKQFMAAVKAVEAIRIEIEGTGPGPSVTVNNNTQVNIRNAPTLAEIDRELTELLTDAGVDRSAATAFVTGLGKEQSALPRHAEKEPAAVEGTPGRLPGGAARLAEGNDLLELPPGIQAA